MEKLLHVVSMVEGNCGDTKTVYSNTKDVFDTVALDVIDLILLNIYEVTRKSMSDLYYKTHTSKWECDWLPT